MKGNLFKPGSPSIYFRGLPSDRTGVGGGVNEVRRARLACYAEGFLVIASFSRTNSRVRASLRSAAKPPLPGSQSFSISMASAHRASPPALDGASLMVWAWRSARGATLASR